jgi:hypothetical protein
LKATILSFFGWLDESGICVCVFSVYTKSYLM